PAGGFLEIYAPSQSRPQAKQPGRLATCLQRSVAGGNNPEAAMALLQAWLASAIGLGASLLDGPRQEAFGVEAWLLDPEANRLLLLVQNRVS
ncbi:MAG: VOC family protein, partial [Cyanobium sp. MAG_185]|nr:VOC family protein [Cyanobium sp. MAG_185]